MNEIQQVEMTEPADVVLPFNTLTRSGTNALVRTTVAARFKQARELNGWDQREAAVRMGYENGTQLSLIELGRRNTPLAVFCVASTVYGVSVDFLLGLSDEPERDPAVAERQAVLRHVEGMLREHAAQVLEMISEHMNAATKPISLARRLLGVASTATETFDRFATLNGEAWEDMPGGAMLLKAMVELETVTQAALEALGKQERLAVFRAACAAATPMQTVMAIARAAPRPKLLPVNAT
ncbi:helix-turn-helix domain-containing protein [Ideonella sp.]|uniref:helix-turn-helix domain-containing protein n=1 Tax=Ideonella sp. TaxID=1929293 RepID=UPI0035B0D6CE